MSNEPDVFRRLQQHLDQLAVGFPAVESGAELRLLQVMFTPEEALLALNLSNRHDTLDEITARLADGRDRDRARQLLDVLTDRGVLGWTRHDGVDRWFLQPLVVGMYETYSGGIPRPEFLQHFGPYMETGAFARAFLSSQPFQTRTVPVNQAIPAEHHVAHYDNLEQLVASSPGPFVLLPCICRQLNAARGQACQQTSRRDSCFAFGDLAAQALRGPVGREVTREEALEHLRASERDGLVLQTTNAQEPEWVCACCGCCCGLLSMRRQLPRPNDVWLSDYRCVADADACSQCEECLERCQVGALTMTGPRGAVAIDEVRCIGCGLCVTTCPTGALQMVHKDGAVIPPTDTESLMTASAANRARAVARG